MSSRIRTAVCRRDPPFGLVEDEELRLWIERSWGRAARGAGSPPEEHGQRPRLRDPGRPHAVPASLGRSPSRAPPRDAEADGPPLSCQTRESRQTVTGSVGSTAKALRHVARWWPGGPRPQFIAISPVERDLPPAPPASSVLFAGGRWAPSARGCCPRRSRRLTVVEQRLAALGNTVSRSIFEEGPPPPPARSCFP